LILSFAQHNTTPYTHLPGHVDAGPEIAPRAHSGQRHAFPRNASGTRSSTSGLITTPVHQHATAKSPALAGAHWFGFPQRGHTWFGKGFTGCPAWRCNQRR